MVSKRFLMVPEDSSAARIPRPGATIALATLLSSARFINSSQSQVRRGASRPGSGRFLAGRYVARLLRSVAAAVEFGVKVTASVTLRHGGEGDRLDLRGLAGRPEFLEPLPAELNHRLHGGFQILARVEFAFVFGEHPADFTGHRHPVVGVDVDLAHAVADAALDFLDRDPPGL